MHKNDLKKLTKLKFPLKNSRVNLDIRKKVKSILFDVIPH